MTKVKITKNQAEELLRRLPDWIKLINESFVPYIIIFDNKSKCTNFVDVEFRNKKE